MMRQSGFGAIAPSCSGDTRGIVRRHRLHRHDAADRSAQDIIRACLAAARAGKEWGLYQALPAYRNWTEGAASDLCRRQAHSGTAPPYRNRWI